MSQQVMTPPILVGGESSSDAQSVSNWGAYIPFVLAIVGSFLMATARINFGGVHFISDGACMMLALASYLVAAVFYLTNMYAPFRFAEKLGLWATTLGVFFNLSSWLVRWISAYDREVQIFNSQGTNPADMPWVFRYIPFANLYDLSLAFAFGAGVTTLLVIRRRQFRIIAALSLPLAAIILVLARFIGSELIDLPPVLDSYWRPIHVGIASMSYGIALVCFTVAVLYILKDGVKVEKMALWTSIFALAVFATVSKMSLFSPTTFGSYTASVFAGTSRASLALRADIPYVGWLLVLAAGLLIGSGIAYFLYLYQNNEKARGWGHKLLWLAMIAQATGIGMLVYQIKNISNVVSYVGADQYQTFARWMLQQQGVAEQQINAIPATQMNDIAARWITDNGPTLHLSMNANPVELSALITAFAGTFFVLLFMINTAKLRNALPASEKLDGLMYKLGGVTFAGLALLLITGAVWANESWGRYWGWDAKEVGALVAWLTYAGFLHSRIAYSWKGRRSAYFAIVAFLFVVFTYLGVSYLLPGLHSYA